MREICSKLIISVIIIIFIISYNLAQGSYSQKPSGVSDVSSDGYLFTELAGDLLTVDIRDVNLEKVLNQLSAQNGITFLLPPSLAEDKVMVRFSHYKIDEGLNKILSPYNRIFIYFEQDQNPDQPPLIRLKEVRIYPRSSYKGNKMGKLELTSVKRPKSSKPSKESKSRDKSATHSRPLKGKNPKMTVGKVRALAKMGDDNAIKQLASAMNDKNPEVRKEAEKALEEIQESLIKENEDESQGDDDKEDSPPPDQGEANLTITTGSENGVNLVLNNEGAVRGMQFTINGAKPTEIRPINRAEGFFYKYNEKNGRVVLVSISGKEIAPGTGPIAEIICDKGGSPTLSDVKIQ